MVVVVVVAEHQGDEGVLVVIVKGGVLPRRHGRVVEGRGWVLAREEGEEMMILHA